MKSLKQILGRKGFQDHKAPVSRRDFVKLGMLAGGGLLMPATLSQRAQAATGGAMNIPFLVIDCAGGAGLPANFLVGHKGGPEDLFDDYTKLGWNPRASQLDKTFGIPMAASASQILAGMKSSLPSALTNPSQKNFKMSSICHFSLDDTSGNRTSALTAVSRAGLRGTLVKAGIGQVASGSGSNSSSYLEESRFRPQAVLNFNDVENLIKIGPNFDRMEASSRRQLLNSLIQSAKGDAGLATAYKELFSMGSNPQTLDARLNPEIARIYGLEAGNAGSDRLLEASIVFNVLMGNTGPGAITIDGCDYHDNTQATGDAKDAQIGRAIGSAVAAANALKKPLFIQVVTDGGVYAMSSQNYERVWVGDANLHSLTLMGFYDPTGRVEQTRQQVGYYSKAGQVDLQTLMGSSTNRMVEAVIANYLNLHGALGKLNEVTGTRPSNDELDQFLVFA